MGYRLGDEPQAVDYVRNDVDSLVKRVATLEQQLGELLMALDPAAPIERVHDAKIWRKRFGLEALKERVEALEQRHEREDTYRREQIER